MEKLKFGHRVIAGCINEKEFKATFIKKETKSQRIAVLKSDSNIKFVDHCKLDPDATEFIEGDCVEMSNNKDKWYNLRYGHKDGDWHLDIKGYRYAYCRYPQSKEQRVKEILERELKLRAKSDRIAKEIVEALND